MTNIFSYKSEAVFSSLKDGSLISQIPRVKSYSYDFNPKYAEDLMIGEGQPEIVYSNSKIDFDFATHFNSLTLLSGYGLINNSGFFCQNFDSLNKERNFYILSSNGGDDINFSLNRPKYSTFYITEALLDKVSLSVDLDSPIETKFSFKALNAGFVTGSENILVNNSNSTYYTTIPSGRAFSDEVSVYMPYDVYLISSGTYGPIEEKIYIKSFEISCSFERADGQSINSIVEDDRSLLLPIKTSINFDGLVKNPINLSPLSEFDSINTQNLLLDFRKENQHKFFISIENLLLSDIRVDNAINTTSKKIIVDFTTFLGESSFSSRRIRFY